MVGTCDCVCVYIHVCVISNNYIITLHNFLNIHFVCGLGVVVRECKWGRV